MSRIKLMVDYNFGKNVAKALNELGSVKAKTIIDYGFKQNTPDSELVDGTSDHNCILLTHDGNSINEKKYPPCSHGGIIISLDPKWSPEKIFEKVKKFVQSGHRSKADHCVTYLYDDRANIHKHDGEVESIDF